MMLSRPADLDSFLANVSLAVSGAEDPTSVFEARLPEVAAVMRENMIGITHAADRLQRIAEAAGLCKDSRGQDWVQAQLDRAFRAPANGHHATDQLDEQPAPRFVPVSLDDIQMPAGPAYLIDGILPARGLAVVAGAPKAGKSAMVADMAAAIAQGASYGGRATLQGPVFLLTKEGVIGSKRRAIALRRHRGIEGAGVPLFFIDDLPDIGSEKTDVGQMIADLDRFITTNELPAPLMIVLDTLARAIGEGDENSARDMGRAVNRCEQIERHFGCLVALVHHIGKDPTKGARGSNALGAAGDVLIVVEKSEGHNTATVEEMKDGPEGTTWTFRLVPFDLSATLDDPCATMPEVAACVVEMLSEPASAQPRATSRAKPPAGVAGDLLNIIKRAAAEVGAACHAAPIAVSRIDLKRYCETMAWQHDSAPNAFRAMLSKTLSQLRSRGLVGFDRDHVWLA